MSTDRHLAVLDAVPDTPAVVVDRGLVQRNIDAMAADARAGGKLLRPHAKTHKMLEVARMQLAAGSRGLQVAKIGEAEALLPSGVDDIFVGYPIVGAQKIARLLDLAEKVAVSISLDDLAVAEPIARAAHARGMTLPVLLEINTGMDRVGVTPDRAVATARRLADLPGLRIRGVKTHEGQALSRSANTADTEREAYAACALMVATAEAIRADGIPCPEVSLGCTVTARFDVRAPGVTEVRPGTYVFYDATQVAHGQATFADVAAWVVATVVSRPDDQRAVIDAGSKVLSSDRLNQKDAPVTRTSGLRATRSAKTYSSWRALLPPKARPVRSSRFTQMSGPPSAAESRGRCSSGVGRSASGIFAWGARSAAMRSRPPALTGRGRGRRRARCPRGRRRRRQGPRR